MGIFNLMQIVAPIIVPYYGYGLDVTAIPTWGLVTMAIFLFAIIVLLDIMVVMGQKNDFNGPYSDSMLKVIIIFGDVLLLATNIVSGVAFYIIIDEIVGRF